VSTSSYNRKIQLNDVVISSYVNGTINSLEGCLKLPLLAEFFKVWTLEAIEKESPLPNYQCIVYTPANKANFWVRLECKKKHLLNVLRDLIRGVISYCACAKLRYVYMISVNDKISIDNKKSEKFLHEFPFKENWKGTLTSITLHNS